MTLEGMMKYMVFTPLTIVGAVSMYIFGAGIETFLTTWLEIFSGDFIAAFMTYFVESALPPTSLLDVIGNIILGTVVAGVKWFIVTGAA